METSEVEIYNEGLLFKGLLYFPPVNYKKPYPIIIFFHGFPQLFTLNEIVNKYRFLLDLGFSFLVFNFRGYRYSEGKVSIQSQITDGLKVIEFAEKMAENKVFDSKNINILGHKFGAFIALLVSAKIKIINKLVLLSPIIDLQRHVSHDDFPKAIEYLNRFLPGIVKGIEDIDKFIEMTQRELSKKSFQIERAIRNLRINKLKIIIGELDKVTPLSELNKIIQNSNVKPELAIIEGMGHDDCVEDEDIEKLNGEIKRFFEDD